MRGAIPSFSHTPQLCFDLGTKIVSALKSTRTETIKKGVERVVRVTKYITGNVRENVRFLKVSRGCPFVFVVNAC